MPFIAIDSLRSLHDRLIELGADIRAIQIVDSLSQEEEQEHRDRLRGMIAEVENLNILLGIYNLKPTRVF